MTKPYSSHRFIADCFIAGNFKKEVEEKIHFMAKKGIVLGHKISKNGIEVDKAKVDVIAKLPHPTTVKGIRSFLGHVGFYRRFIQDFSKIARPMTRLLEKDTPFFFSKEYVEAFQILQKKLTKSPIPVAPDWDLPFELMCDASDFAIGNVVPTKEQILQRCEALLLGRPLLVQNLCESSHPAVEAKALPTNDARVVCKFLKSLFARFGTPRAIISDREMHFCNDQFAKVMLKLKIFLRKLKTRWSGPFTITQVFPYGTIKLSKTDGPNFKVNGHRLKHYFREDIPKMVVPDLQTSPRTNEFKDWVKLSDPKQALRILDFEDSCLGFCPSITGSSLPQLY
nr:reverse transcriptase domain-containing protein [Tanacetum cinerariifolium]